ncbi:siderophore-interacting protein [Actinocrispum sp. NPDC049592]|uniref:siderophore-interacting protein n=1 Tax=Actinocrispum sp. NPDC049592 TaxID=3154835 RepID=UPI00344338EE
MTTPATPVRRLLDRFLCRGTVEAVDDLTPRMRRIRITGESVRGLAWVPGQHVRLQVGDLFPNFGNALRTYSVWDYAGDGRLDLCILDHPEGGPGARWARDVTVGQEVAFTRPEGRLVIHDDAPYQLFVGDETAAVAFGAMLRALPASARVFGLLEANGPDDRLPLPRELTWVYRDAEPLTTALEALDLPAEPGVAYIAGEARTCQAVRRHLVRDRGWPRKTAIVKPFWAPGKRGMD